MLERFRDPETPFLEAVWSNVCIVTYAVAPEVVEPHVDDRLELETRDGRAFASLVAFDFEDTKVWNVGWPGFRSFPAVNLQVHVRYRDRRGVSLVREFVPQPFVAWMAGLLYRQPSESVPMESHVHTRDGEIEVRHEWSHGGSIHRLRLVAGERTSVPDETSDAHHFKEYHWGFGTNSDGELLAFEVDHPVWETHAIASFDVDVDWDVLFGNDWAPLHKTQPDSVVLAAGSPVTVYPKRPVEELED